MKTKRNAKTVKRATSAASLIDGALELLLGSTYASTKDLPPHMQALVALGDHGADLTNPKERRLVAAGFQLALQLAKISAVVMAAPQTKDRVIFVAVKKSVELAARRIQGHIERPDTGSKVWDRLEGMFWNGVPASMTPSPKSR